MFWNFKFFKADSELKLRQIQSSCFEKRFINKRGTGQEKLRRNSKKIISQNPIRIEKDFSSEF